MFEKIKEKVTGKSGRYPYDKNGCSEFVEYTKECLYRMSNINRDLIEEFLSDTPDKERINELLNRMNLRMEYLNYAIINMQVELEHNKM